MTSKYLTAAFLAATAVSASSAQPAPQAPQAPAAQVAEKAPEEKICKKLPSTGTRMEKKACLTKKEWDELEKELGN